MNRFVFFVQTCIWHHQISAMAAAAAVNFIRASTGSPYAFDALSANAAVGRAYTALARSWDIGRVILWQYDNLTRQWSVVTMANRVAANDPRPMFACT